MNIRCASVHDNYIGFVELDETKVTGRDTSNNNVALRKMVFEWNNILNGKRGGCASKEGNVKLS